MAMQRRAATTAEAKALANPLRLRILRLCLDEPWTNKELALRLGKDPATVLHHVRTLVDTGFLAPEPVRTGASGALEKPYRATGKSWTLDVQDQGTVDATVAMLDAVRDEIVEAGTDAVDGSSRAGLRLTEASFAELKERLQAVVEEFADRSPEPGGDPYGVFFVLHHRR